MDTIPIPPDATDDQLRQLEMDARAMLRSRECPRWLRSGGQGCLAGAEPHDEHYTQWFEGNNGGGDTVVVRWRSNPTAGEG